MRLPQKQTIHICDHIIPDLIESGKADFLDYPLPVLPYPLFSSTNSCPEEEDSEKRTKYEIADIFKIHGEEYRKNHKLTFEQQKAMFDIEHCRTSIYGYHIDVCDNCMHMEISYNSCGNRHCPKCQGIAKRKWVNSRIDELLPINYHHATFTVPVELSCFSQYNRQLIYDLLFESSSRTLLDFGEDPKWLGAKIGFYGILHTWSQTMWNHIHIHYIVTAGGITEDGEWKEPKYKSTFLFPVRAVAKVFRGKLMEGLKKLYYSGKLVIPYDRTELNDPDEFEKWLNRLCWKKWIVDSRAPFAGPEEVVRYIGRYTHRVAISNSRILSIENGSVRFKYKDNKEKDKSKIWKEMTLPAEQFIERFLMHVLPKRYHRIRHFGFLTNGQKNFYVQKIREILQCEEISDATGTPLSGDAEGYVCPECEQGRMRPFIVTDGYGKVTRIHPEAVFLQKEAYDSS